MQTAIASIEAMRRTVPAYRTKYPPIEYKNVEKMIIKAAKKASLNSGVSFEEMKAQADLLYVIAVKTFNPDRGVKFSTFLHTCLHNGLINHGLALCKHDLIEKTTIYEDDKGMDLQNSLIDDRAEQSFEFVDMYNSLSTDETKLVDLVLLGFASSLSLLKKLAIERLGFDLVRFDNAVKEIRDKMNEY